MSPLLYSDPFPYPDRQVHRVALTLAEDLERQRLDALRVDREADVKQAAEVRKALEEEATGLSEKLSDLSKVRRQGMKSFWLGFWLRW